MPEHPTPDDADAPAWLAVELADAKARRKNDGGLWQEFMRVPDLYAGLYEIPAGGEDPQSPHDADEVYHVLGGRATLVVEGDRIPVGPGSVIYVGKKKEHRFVEILEDLSVLVFFATTGQD